MAKRIAQILSVLFHPLLMPSFGLFWIFNSGTYASYLPFEYQKSLYIIVGISTFVLPLSIIPMFLYKKLISNVELDKRQDRIIPLIVTLVLFYVDYYLISRLSAPHIIESFILSTVIVVLITLIITIWWKISAHGAGLGGIAGLLIATSFRFGVDFSFPLIGIIVISGLVLSSRLFLNAHNSAQVYSGFGLGVIATFISVYYF
ncbi:MAG: hypothetical protein C0594_11490 [Marinilabiliales bacterium]|nr:MAG: hypothetical protein C0594_11490 [Marinilabiliales bacterium]